MSKREVRETGITLNNMNKREIRVFREDKSEHTFKS